MAGISEELARLAQLRDQGVLTEEEFQTQKAVLLSREQPAATPVEIAPAKKKRGAVGCLGIVVIIIIVLIVIGAIAGGGRKPVVPPTNAASGEHTTTESNEAGEDGKLSIANYNRIRTGMTYKQVVVIIGDPSEEMSRNELAGIETVMYQWNGGLGSNMNAMFQNGKLVQKAQFGLR